MPFQCPACYQPVLAREWQHCEYAVFNTEHNAAPSDSPGAHLRLPTPMFGNHYHRLPAICGKTTSHAAGRTIAADSTTHRNVLAALQRLSPYFNTLNPPPRHSQDINPGSCCMTMYADTAASASVPPVPPQLVPTPTCRYQAVAVTPARAGPAIRSVAGQMLAALPAHRSTNNANKSAAASGFTTQNVSSDHPDESLLKPGSMRTLHAQVLNVDVDASATAAARYPSVPGWYAAAHAYCMPRYLMAVLTSLSPRPLQLMTTVVPSFRVGASFSR